MVSMFMFMEVISQSLFPVWLFQNNHSAIYRSRQGFLYNACPVLVNVQHDVLQLLGKCCHTSPIIATNGLWSVMTHTSLPKQKQ